VTSDTLARLLQAVQQYQHVQPNLIAGANAATLLQLAGINSAISNG